MKKAVAVTLALVVSIAFVTVVLAQPPAPEKAAPAAPAISPAAEQPLCIFTVDPKTLYFEAQGGTDEVTVTPEHGCTLAPRTACHWITLSLSEEVGKKTVVIQVDPHHNMAQRFCSVMVGNTQVDVVQKARDYVSW